MKKRFSRNSGANKVLALLLSISFFGSSVSAYAQDFEEIPAEDAVAETGEIESYAADPLYDEDGTMLNEDEIIFDDEIDPESASVEEGLMFYNTEEDLAQGDMDLTNAVPREAYGVTEEAEGTEPAQGTAEKSKLSLRKKVSNTRVHPYSAICKLYMDFGDGSTYVGTGFVIGPRTILTAAHCLYDYQYRNNNKSGYVKNLTIIPGLYEDSTYYYTPFDEYSSSSGDIKFVKVEPSYISESKKAAGSLGAGQLTQAMSSVDTGIIRLNTNIASKTGYLRLSTEGRMAKTARVSGYPAQVNYIDNEYSQYQATGNVDQTHLKLNDYSHRRIEFDEIGSGGQSGSPTMNSAGQPFAIFNASWTYTTRYSFYTTKDTVSSGVLIDSARLNFIQQYSDMEPAVYRLYNPNTGEHFYTMNYQETRACVKAGWKDEGLAWRSSNVTNRMPVYRVYNPNSGDHHYTANRQEYDNLKKLGWRQEGVSWYAPKKEYYRKIYRLYNKNAKTGQHHFTIDANEKNALVKAGWKYEGNPFNAR